MRKGLQFHGKFSDSPSWLSGAARGHWEQVVPVQYGHPTWLADALKGGRAEKHAALLGHGSGAQRCSLCSALLSGQTYSGLGFQPVPLPRGHDWGCSLGLPWFLFHNRCRSADREGPMCKFHTAPSFGLEEHLKPWLLTQNLSKQRALDNLTGSAFS